MKQTLTSDKISSLDQSGSRRHLLLAEVTGVWRRYRNIVQSILMLVFLITPWTTWNGNQTVLINIIDREFSFFGILFRAHHAPMLFFLIAGGALSLAFVTSVWGRVWCGWACPQTVFTDGVFRRIEYWIEGDYLKRAALEQADLNFNKLFKKSVKWILFFAAAAIIAHSFLAYFVGAHRFISIIQNGPDAHPTLFKFAVFFTLLFLFDFAWFKEQFCTIMCPYGRIQGILLDKTSLVVEFNTDRKQDCISCQRCVNVCPIGIDIRNGLQMECIQCTACIDACDEIMDKVKKPRGLVQYATLDKSPIRITKPRSLLYMSGILVCILGLSYSTYSMKHSEVFILRGIETPYKVIKNSAGESKILNHFRLQLSNQSSETQTYKISLNQPDPSINTVQLAIQSDQLSIEPKQFKEVHLFIEGPMDKSFVSSKQLIRIVDFKDPKNFSKDLEVTIIGPQVE